MALPPRIPNNRSRDRRDHHKHEGFIPTTKGKSFSAHFPNYLNKYSPARMFARSIQRVLDRKEIPVNELQEEYRINHSLNRFEQENLATEAFNRLKKKIIGFETSWLFHQLDEVSKDVDLDIVARCNVVLLPEAFYKGIQELVDLYFYGEDSVKTYIAPFEEPVKEQHIYGFNMEKCWDLVVNGPDWMIYGVEDYRHYRQGFLAVCAFDIVLNSELKVLRSKVKRCE